MAYSQPAYIEAYKTGYLRHLADVFNKRLNDCDLCPRKCHVNRTMGDLGTCKTGRLAMVASYAPHFGEEPPIVGTQGSGTIFFTHCNLGCTFCQNYDISHEGYGVEISDSHLARIMITLQHLGCHNINCVTPTHVVPQILSALEIAVTNGLNIPLIYNSSGYDDPETLALLEGIVDIYMPDFKFWDPDVAGQTCQASDYPQYAREAIREMYRQVGNLVTLNGKAVRGLLIRHLVLPNNLSGTEPVMNYIAREISSSAFVNIMDQYRPSGEAHKGEKLNRSITRQEYDEAIKAAQKAGLTTLHSDG